MVLFCHFKSKFMQVFNYLVFEGYVEILFAFKPGFLFLANGVQFRLLFSENFGLYKAFLQSRF